MTLVEELRSRNFSIYGQWLGIFSLVLCFALGIANIFHFDVIVVFSVICLLSAFLILFIELPLLLRICPTSSKFDAFMQRFTTNYMRAGIYLAMSTIQWLSLVRYATSLIACAVLLLMTAVCYAVAGAKGQGFVGSKTLGGQGVGAMIL